MSSLQGCRGEAVVLKGMGEGWGAEHVIIGVFAESRARILRTIARHTDGKRTVDSRRDPSQGRRTCRLHVVYLLGG